MWERQDVIRPIIVIRQYNAVSGDLHPTSAPRDRSFSRTKAHYSNLYFGASLAAHRSLANRAEYRSVDTTSAGNDAFLCERILDPYHIWDSPLDCRA